MAQSANKLIRPDQAKREDAPAKAIDQWEEMHKRLQSHGSPLALAPLFRINALKQIMVGRAKGAFDLLDG